MNACEVIAGNCLDVLPAIKTDMRKVIVTDPPFNIGYHYKGYSDRVGDYMGLLAKALSFADAFVVVHYPEALHELSIKLGKAPDRVVSWVYNSNTRRQHRDIAFYGIKPDFSLVRQPYKNPKDKRIAERIARGITGGASYDWIEANQVKNVTKGRGG